ncbi:MAG: GNAT family N-acetyltransferase [Vampirovibrio sp.]|nr:GNAT family N-acetyltransferase [Vampirovibrio sp.]
MTSVEISLAQPEDLPALLAMIQALATFEKISDQVQISLSELETALSSSPPQAYALMAKSDGKPAGYALLIPCLYLKRSQHKLILEDFYVDDAYRGQQIGAKLIQAIQAFAQENNAFKIEFGVYNWNEPAQKFYQRMGATPATTWTTYQFLSDG